MFDRILVATEGTPIMNTVMRYAATLFPDAEYHVITVVDTSVGSVHLTAALVKILEERGERALEKARNIFREYGIRIRTATLRGEPSRAIVRYADLEGADLVVLGSSTKTGVVKFTFGHVGETLIRNLKQPLIVINQRVEIRRPARILCPTDGGTHSREAGEIALSLAKHVDGTLFKYYLGSDADLGKRVLETARARALEMGVREVETLDITPQDPGEEILKLAPKFDAIVMGKGRRSLFRRDQLGFISREVAALSPVAVFLVGGCNGGRRGSRVNRGNQGSRENRGNQGSRGNSEKQG